MLRIGAAGRHASPNISTITESARTANIAKPAHMTAVMFPIAVTANADSLAGSLLALVNST
jgi:hypothetical protein